MPQATGHKQTSLEGAIDRNLAREWNLCILLVLLHVLPTMAAVSEVRKQCIRYILKLFKELRPSKMALIAVDQPA